MLYLLALIMVCSVSNYLLMRQKLCKKKNAIVSHGQFPRELLICLSDGAFGL